MGSDTIAMFSAVAQGLHWQINGADTLVSPADKLLRMEYLHP